MASKRRLPVLKSPGDGDPDEPPRPPWQWIGFGTLGIFTVWLPLAWLATMAAMRMGGDGVSPALRAAPFAVSLALAAVAGGYLVGRWGPAGVGVREAALAGLSTAIIATVLAWGTAGFSLGALVTVVLATPPAALGGRLGMKKRFGAW